MLSYSSPSLSITEGDMDLPRPGLLYIMMGMSTLEATAAKWLYVSSSLACMSIG